MRKLSYKIVVLTAGQHVVLFEQEKKGNSSPHGSQQPFGRFYEYSLKSSD